MARPAFEATEDKRRQVKMMAALGCRHEDISIVLAVTPKTLRKHFRKELDLGAIEANTKVMGTLFSMATSGKNTAASIFWAKTRCGLREKSAEQRTGSTLPPAFVVRLEE